MAKILCVVGPTASGKTALAVELAKAYSGEVLSCDSMQLYQYMDIGTAKPTEEEMQGIPHHMIGVLDPRESCSVSHYCEMADPILQDILARGKTAVICGGTGLYAEALIKGTDFAAAPSTGVRQQLEQRLEEEGLEALSAELAGIDPEALEKAQKNPRRILRALEIWYETGKTVTAHNAETRLKPPKYEALWLGIDYVNRQQLYDRIDLRVDRMLQQGLRQELEKLLAMGIPEDATALQAIGYKEFLDARAGRCSWEQAAEELKRASRRYAKRQLTWFRRNEAVQWLRRDADTAAEEILSAAGQKIAYFDKTAML